MYIIKLSRVSFIPSHCALQPLKNPLSVFIVLKSLQQLEGIFAWPASHRCR